MNHFVENTTLDDVLGEVQEPEYQEYIRLVPFKDLPPLPESEENPLLKKLIDEVFTKEEDTNASSLLDLNEYFQISDTLDNNDDVVDYRLLPDNHLAIVTVDNEKGLFTLRLGVHPNDIEKYQLGYVYDFEEECIDALNTVGSVSDIPPGEWVECINVGYLPNPKYYDRVGKLNNGSDGSVSIGELVSTQTTDKKFMISHLNAYDGVRFGFSIYDIMEESNKTREETYNLIRQFLQKASSIVKENIDKELVGYFEANFNVLVEARTTNFDINPSEGITELAILNLRPEYAAYNDGLLIDIFFNRFTVGQDEEIPAHIDIIILPDTDAITSYGLSHFFNSLH